MYFHILCGHERINEPPTYIELMNKVLILSTHWREDYWKTDGEATARYPETEYTRMPDWDEVEEACPVPGIGKYHTRLREKEFVYLRIKEISYVRSTGEPKFVHESIGESDAKSYELDEELSGQMFFTVGQEDIVEVLEDLGEEIPEDWIN